MTPLGYTAGKWSVAPGDSFAGIYGSFGWNEGIVRDFDLSTAGRVKFDAYSIGLYATHYGPGGWYVDAVVQGTRYVLPVWEPD